MFAFSILHLYLHKWCQEKNTCTGKPQRSSLRIHLCASERSERAIFGVFNHFRVKKVSFFTINVKFKVILSSKSGGMFVQATPPTQNSGGIHPPIPPPRDLRQCIVLSDLVESSGYSSKTLQKGSCPYRRAGTLWVLEGQNLEGGTFVWGPRRGSEATERGEGLFQKWEFKSRVCRAFKNNFLGNQT